MKVAGAGAVSENAAVFRRYPKRDGKGLIEWIHWADLELASAWAAEGLRALDAFVAKHSGTVSDARTLEGGARTALNSDARDALVPLNNAFQALNVPPLLSLPSEEFGCVNLLWSFVAIRDGRIEVRTTVLGGPGSCVKPASRVELIALKKAIVPEEPAYDTSVVVDIRTRRVVFRGGFDAGLAFKTGAAHRDRAYLALWARKPWALDRGDDVEFITSEPIVWERDRFVRKLQMARPILEQLERDPWDALVSERARVRVHNDTLAGEWMGQLPALATTRSQVDVHTIRAIMDRIAQARSERALEQARAQAREALATGAGTAAGVLGTLSAIAPPAAIVLAPAGAVLAAVAALAGLFLQVIPRGWLAMAEVVPPRLPVPNMISGDEGANESPTILVTAPPAFDRARWKHSAPPTLLDPDPVLAVTTMSGTVALPRVSTTLMPSQRTPLAPTAIATLLDRERSTLTLTPTTSTSAQPVLSSPARSTASDQRPSPGAARTLIAIGLGVGALALAWRYAAR
jgi:hypothetical protein